MTSPLYHMPLNDQSQQKVTHCNLLKFQCDQNWDVLTETCDPRIRFCQRCREKVYLCFSEAEFRHHAANYHCVAIAASVWADTGSQTDASIPFAASFVGTPFGGAEVFFKGKHKAE
jgi:hypothetical protein